MIKIKERTWVLMGGLFGMVLMLMLFPQLLYAGKLKVVTIPQEDQLREKGILIICPTNGTNQYCPEPDLDYDPHTEYKIHFVDPQGNNVDPVSITCTVIEKDVCHVPTGGGKQPGRRQTDLLDVETEATDLFNISDQFVCKYRSVKPGVGVLEVYFMNTPVGSDSNRNTVFIGDHILKVEAEDANGNKGAEIQDFCVLGFPTCGFFGEPYNCTQSAKVPDFFFPTKWPDDTIMNKYADPIYPFASCKNIALWQREVLGEEVQFCFEDFKLRGFQDP